MADWEIIVQSVDDRCGRERITHLAQGVVAEEKGVMKMHDVGLHRAEETVEMSHEIFLGTGGAEEVIIIVPFIVKKILAIVRRAYRRNQGAFVGTPGRGKWRAGLGEEIDGKVGPSPHRRKKFLRINFHPGRPDFRVVVDEVENPNPAATTNNWYTQDGYGGGSFGAASYGGGSYTDCHDTTQPGVEPIAKYLKSLATPIKPNCEENRYYLLNNYNPGYFGNGNNAYTDTNAANTVFTIPPSSVPSIGDDMLKNNVSWKYYGDQWNNYVPDPYQLNYGAIGKDTDEYCNICNPVYKEQRYQC